ncbi:MAG TPA: beta-ketoacyl-[acyl-carrier-protein] synthase family protein, partial [Acidimicrobiales bacterium]|nr:beta-ketoacyl-[acyl-carrier-protein] synthase family protein [Acidimicrobiales bacterium]
CVRPPTSLCGSRRWRAKMRAKCPSRAEVVVTGLGVVTPLGRTVEDFWENALMGTEALGRLKRFDVARLSSDIGAEVPHLEARGDGVRGGLASAWALDAARQAVADAAVLDCGVSDHSTGVCFGTVMGNRPALEWPIESQAALDLDRESAWANPSQIARSVARGLGVHGPTCTIATACAAGNSAIAYGVDALRAGRADAMVVGGTDEISLGSLLVFDSFRALTKDRVRPFDQSRQGLALGEGAAALVLERRVDAEARRVGIHGTVLGSGNVCDSYHITSPDPGGGGAVRGMKRALAEAGLEISDVDHISAHGTGTVANDRAEANAIRSLLGPDLAEGVPVTALKSLLGHAQGAASAIEAVACLLTIRDQLIPPTLNYRSAEPGCRLDVVHDAPRRERVRVALSNAFGFGGNIECVLFGE